MGILVLIVLFVAIVGVGEYFMVYWIVVIDLIVLIMGLFCLYNFMLSRLGYISGQLKDFIKKDNEMQKMGITVKVGKYGILISFAVIN